MKGQEPRLASMALLGAFCELARFINGAAHFINLQQFTCRLGIAWEWFQFHSREDLFRFQCTDLGQLQRVRVRHDDTGVGPGWFLEWLEVCRCEDGKVWRLPYGHWLDAGEGEGVLECELRVGDKGEAKQATAEGWLITTYNHI